MHGREEVRGGAVAEREKERLGERIASMANGGRVNNRHTNLSSATTKVSVSFAATAPQAWWWAGW